MPAKLFAIRSLAKQDIDEALTLYLAQSATQTALTFVDALEVAYAQIGRRPGAGSMRYAYEFNLPGLRFSPLKRIPHLVFYVERANHIEVWRVLHNKRDIPAWMHAGIVT